MKGVSPQLETGSLQSQQPCEKGLDLDDRQAGRDRTVAWSPQGLVLEAQGRHNGPRRPFRMVTKDFLGSF